MSRFIISALLLISGTISMMGQNFNLSKFTNAQGLPQNYVYSIVQDDNGYIWIGLAEGLSRYDGLKFTNYTTRDSLSDNYVSAMLLDTDGMLWCGHGNGQLTYGRNGSFHKVRVDGVSSPIKDMCLDDKGNIWAVEQSKGIIRVNADRSVETLFDRERFGRRIYYSIRAVNSLTLLVGTSEGMIIVKMDVDGQVRDIEEVEDLPTTAVNCIREANKEGTYLLGTDDGQIFRYSLSGGSTKIERNVESCTAPEETLDIRSVYETETGDLYIATWGQGLKEWKYQEQNGKFIETLTLNEANGLGNNFVSSITLDREGIFWFGTYGGGIVAWINNYFAQYDLSEIGFQRSKISSAVVEGNDLWIGLNIGLVKMDKQCMANFEYYDSSLGLPSGLSVTAICFDKAHNMQYVGTDVGGIYVRRGNGRYFNKLYYNEASRTCEMINGLLIDNNKLYIASQGGFIVYNLLTGVSRCYTTLDGLPHNNINFVNIDNDGQIWLGAKDSGITMFAKDGTFEVHRLSDMPIDVAGITVDDRDRFWVATVNNGVICTSNDSVVSISTADGLEKNYCYGIAADNNDRIWVCHQPGLSCIDLNTGNIRSFNLSNGLGQEFNGVSTDENGDLWFTSTSSVTHYISQYDRRNSTAPIINLSKVTISGKKHNLNEEIDLSYPYDGNMAKFDFDFIGICMKDPLNVRYEYWLQKDGDEIEHWMSLGTQNHKEFDFMPEGDNILHVRAFNSDGIVCKNPLSIKIHIDAPFWRSIFFPVVLVIIVFIIVRIITRWREQKLKQRQQELEAEVNRQTITLREQKGEIEQKNKDIMDSINYAKRIQTAILPPINSLRDYNFSDSFILFKPRDVVSGDFYWFGQFDDQFLVCCGDCTGHGVPGAFMSMIGTALLNDATHDASLRHPSALLETLDKEIKSTLNKNQSIEAQDGMDCVILSIDLKKMEAVSAGARRPVYVFSKGRMSEIKGSRRGVGEHRNSNEFVETTFELHKGDIIYLCSDGFASQLDGGTPGKPPYTAGALRRYLESIGNEPLAAQKEMLEAEFNSWKGDWEQIDDVIIMGLKI